MLESDEEKSLRISSEIVGCISPLDDNPIIELGSTFNSRIVRLILLKMKRKGFELITTGSYGSADWTSQILYFKKVKQ